MNGVTYLTTDELSARIRYTPATIRNQLKDNVLIEGKHYIRPFGGRKILFLWEPIEVDMWVTRTGGAGFTLGYVVRDPETLGQRVYALAETGLVLYDFRTSRPRRLTEEERSQLEVHVGGPVSFRWTRR